ncbi:uracil-DNA glycosylase [Streptomyces sp. NBC_01089]|uniref:uracil-DNA glycosylase n=1 Tax=Streptomyces sp. NBC_01089 TaxID=2903747 RepID=UPI0038648AD8|nr:uracil-DNA glycosylase [Streptomyces sp. NBC_01089]
MAESQSGVSEPQPSADDRRFPASRAPGCADLAALDAQVVNCRACPRLVAWREQVAVERRAAYRDQEYWGRPVPGFGPADAALAVVGLAPAAHGGNRTGRMFTGDPAGDFLVAALHHIGLASQPTATAADDGLTLHGVRMASPVHCAPPQNKPTTEERDTCRPWLAAELALLRPGLRAVVVLGGFGWQALLPVLAAAGWRLPRPRPVFGHGAQVVLTGPDGRDKLRLFGCYHPSRRNVNTGRLTRPMLTAVFREAATAAGLRLPGPPGATPGSGPGEGPGA